MKLEFSRPIFGKVQIPSFNKIRPMGAELLHADEQEDALIDRHDEGNSRFSQLCERA